MTPRSLFLQFAVALALIVAANVGIKRLAANSFVNQLVRHVEQSEPATDIFLGNSTMAAALDEAAFDAAHPGRRGLNAGLGATGPIEHFLIYAGQDRHRNATVYYGVIDLQLTTPTRDEWSSLTGNRSIVYSHGMEAALPLLAPDDSVKALQLRLTSHVPALVERTGIWAKVERVRRVLGELGMPKKETTRFGRVEDFAEMEPADRDEFASQCALAVNERAPLLPAIRAILQRAKARGEPVVVVEMPRPSNLRERLQSLPEWKAYREYVRSLVREEGADYIVAADWVGDTGFGDHLHVDAVGAKEFSARVGARR